jgi:hypothetical protein
VANARGNPITPTDYKNLVVAGALPNPLIAKKLDWDEVKSKLKVSEKVLPKIQFEVLLELLAVRKKKDFDIKSLEVFPPRTKTDLSLRRMRLNDIRIYFKNRRKEDVFRRLLEQSRVGWDIIFVTNVLLGYIVLGEEWYDRVTWLGLLDGDLDHFITRAKVVSNLIKTTGIKDPNWTHYTEMHSLSGYRTIPFPGFDVFREAEDLAHGGNKHNYFGHNWDSLVRESLPTPYKYVKFITFGDFVRDPSLWITTGASSVGRIVVEKPDGKKISIKARKNMVADVILSLSELANDAINNKNQDNWTIVKMELGKIRLAVAGDLFTYLKMAYVIHLTGGGTKEWPGGTAKEGFLESSKRLGKMIKLCRLKRLGLPYDYDGFDHQPETTELVGIWKWISESARLNVPISEWSHFQVLVMNVAHGFDFAKLFAVDPSAKKGERREETFDVTGGLMSGLYITSVVGDAWNITMTNLVIKIVQSWGIDTTQIERFIRGDDSAIFSVNWATAAAIDLGYKAVGAIGGEGKFSVQDGQMEFLRVWFNHRTWGYPCRSIPTISQRKPWANEPWSVDMTLKAQYEGVKTLRRRTGGVGDIDGLWKTLKRIWCRDHNFPIQVTEATTAQGGLGLEQPLGAISWKIVPPIPKIGAANFKIVNQTLWRAGTIVNRIRAKYGVEVDLDTAQAVADQQLKSTLLTDNLSDVAGILRDEWNEIVRSNHYKAVGIKLNPSVFPEFKMLLDIPYDQPERMIATVKKGCPLFGAYPQISVIKEDYNIIKPDMGFKTWLRQEHPLIAGALSSFHNSWHTSMALDYLEGSIPTPVFSMHPALTGILSRMIASTLKPKMKLQGGEAPWVSKIWESLLRMTPIATTIFQW